MKHLILIPAFLFISLLIISCRKHPVIKPAGLDYLKDTSTTLIANTAIVGNWNLVSDSVSTYSTDTLYHGTPADYYTFTKYGNMYVKSGFNKFFLVGTYSFENSNKIKWQGIYGGDSGNYALLYGELWDHDSLTNMTDHTLVLNSNNIFPGTWLRLEVIKLKK